MLLWSDQNDATKRANSAVAFVVLCFCAVLFWQPARADSPTPPPTVSSDWTLGPAAASLGPIAVLQIKQGYKFLDSVAARALLERSKNPVPKQLLGILAPASEDWWVVLQFSEIGYVKTEETSPAQLAGTLKTLDSQVRQQNAERQSRGLPAFSGVAWEVEPKFDPSAHSLEWAVRKESAGQSVIGQTIRLLGRHGTLDASVVTPFRGFADLAPLKQLARGVIFKAGEAYADYRDGDKVCGDGPAGLVADSGSIMKAPTAAQAGGSTAESPRHKVRLLIAAAATALVVIAGVVLLLKLNGRPKPSSAGKRLPPGELAQENESAAGPVAAPQPVEPAAPAPVFQASLASAGPETPAAATSGKPGLTAGRPRPLAFKPKDPEASPKLVNGKHHEQQRKKVFDYNRYFTDLMTTVSSHSSQMDLPPEPGRTDWPPTEPTPQNLAAATPDFQAQLILSQRLLIEEQRRLIQEQSKIIEDKAKLIAERNKLLKMQSEMLGE